MVFFKSSTALTGPNDGLVIPRDSEKTDWEVELAVVIGKKASYVSEENAPEHIAGYILHNDYSERAWQLERGGQWVKGKSADTFAPLGPWLATPDEIADPHNLRLWLKVNGATKQSANLNQMIWSVAEQIANLSEAFELFPGDIIYSGTPENVGPVVVGDVIEMHIDGLPNLSVKIV